VEAIEDFSKAISLQPKLAEAYSYRADMYEKLNQKPLAEKDRAKCRNLGIKKLDASNTGNDGDSR
jgi:Tfp pilus assembly protein PilF